MAYTRRDWAVGDTITEARIDNMEDGIERAHDGYEGVASDLATVANDLSNTNSDLTNVTNDVASVTNDLAGHEADRGNPHGVTSAQAGVYAIRVSGNTGSKVAGSSAISSARNAEGNYTVTHNFGHENYVAVVSLASIIGDRVIVENHDPNTVTVRTYQGVGSQDAAFTLTLVRF